MEAPIAPETDTLKKIDTLRILVHPSYLVGNPNPSAWGGAVNWEAYIPQTIELRRQVLDRYLPDKSDEVLLVMPHEKPSLESWRIRNRLRKKGELVENWAGIYHSIKKISSYPGNIIPMGDLSNERGGEDERREEAKVKLLDLLTESGYSLNETTRVIIAGEFRDACVREVVRHILLLDEVKSVVVDKRASFTTAHHYISATERGLARADVERHDGFIKLLRDYNFVVSEDDDYVYVQKKNR